MHRTVLAWGFLKIALLPPGPNVTDHSLPPVRDVDMLDRDALLAAGFELLQGQNGAVHGGHPFRSQA